MITTERLLEVYKKPFRYCREGIMIFDANDKHVIDVRGWGYLQKFSDGPEIQDEIGARVASFLNAL